MRICKFLVVVFSIAFLITACASSGTKQKIGAVTGGIIGAIGGAIIGYQVDSDAGGLIAGGLAGAFAGAAIGGGIGRYLDERDKRVKELAKESDLNVNSEVVVTPEQKEEIEKTKNDNATANKNSINKYGVYAISINEIKQFPFNSSKLYPNADTFYEKVADDYIKHGESALLIVGHTDSTGDSTYNQRLSEERAKTVANIFIKKGFPPDRIYIQGAGASEPVATNSTEDGRQKNRRVEIITTFNEDDFVTYKEVKFVESRTIKTAEKKQNNKANNTRPTQAQNSAIKKPVLTGKEEAMPEGFFGGIPLEKDDFPPVITSHHIENPLWSKKIAFSSPAYASDPIPLIFDDEDFIAIGEVKSMKGNNSLYKPKHCIPGYYKAPLYGYVNRHFIYLNPVSIRRDGSLLENPAFGVYENYDYKDSNKEPDYIIKGLAKTYNMDQGVLLRWKAEDSNNMQGIIGVDIRLPVYDRKELKNINKIKTYGKIYYYNKGVIFVQKLDLEI